MKLSLPRSLFGKIVAAQVAMLLLLATTLPTLFSYLLHRTAHHFVAARLLHDAQLVAASLAPAQGGLRQVFVPKLSLMYDKDGGNKSYAVFDANEALIARGPRPIVRPEHLDSIKSGQLFEIGDYDILAYRIRPNGRNAIILVEQNRVDPEVLIDDVVTSFLGSFLWIIPFALLLFFLAGAIAARRASSQILRIARRADHIEPHRLDIRLDSGAGPSELEPLIHAANRALDRLEKGFREQNDFVANVAHELRTPLAVVALRAEAIRDLEVRDSIHASIARTSHVVGQLMELASVENCAPEFQPVDLSIIAQRVIMDHAPLAYRSGKTLELCGKITGELTLEGNAGLISIVLSNLIDNAVRHTPSGTKIKVELGPGKAISVVDNGPGIRRSDSQLVRKRYWRGDHKRTDGAGLGLAISDRIMALHGGRMEVIDTGGFGARFLLVFGSETN